MKKLVYHTCSSFCPSSVGLLFGESVVESKKVSSCFALMFCFPRPMGQEETDLPLNMDEAADSEMPRRKSKARAVSSLPALNSPEIRLDTSEIGLSGDFLRSSRRRSSDRDTRYHSTDGLLTANSIHVDTSLPPASLLQVSDNNKERRTSAPENLALMPCVMITNTRSPGPRYKLLQEGDIQACFVNHMKTVVNKILCSKMLRRWENHHVYLNDSGISSKTPSRYWRTIAYTSMQGAVSRWDFKDKYLIQITLPNACLLLQTNNAYTRDQWFYSICWKKHMFKYQNILTCSTRQDVILKETKNLVDVAVSTPLQDPAVTSTPITIISELLVDDNAWNCRPAREVMITLIAPLLENTSPSVEMCHFFSDHCIRHPRSPVIIEIFTPIVLSILKRNADFSKTPHIRRFIQDYIVALYSHNNNDEVIEKFVSSVHGPISGCPHNRVLTNLVSVCLVSILNNFEERQTLLKSNKTPCPNEEDEKGKESPLDKNLKCYLTVLLQISTYEDWRPSLAALLQPIPLPEDALKYEPFMDDFLPILERISTDPRCDVHQMVLGVREGKEGWFDICCPSSMACTDEGVLWGLMLKTLLQCCCKRKKFIIQVTKQVDSCVLLALRDFPAAQDALCLMMEWELVDTEERKDQIVTTLQSTENGQERYAALCQRLEHLRELQQKGGPRKLSLPNRSTDADLAQMLSCGSFGNLECLSLAFTHVTSASAEHIIKLPQLRHLNLWATQFGDQGVSIISEHLHNLEILNLCETLVSDKGISALTGMTNLKKLNLNSTRLSPQTFQTLQEKLPAYMEYDVRYTDAYSSDNYTDTCSSDTCSSDSSCS